MNVGLVCQVALAENEVPVILHRFVLVTLGATLLLVGWGGFVTSINAGMAVPDWPTTFNSWDPLNPIPNWWKSTPILAEHGHRLLGALVGILTVILAILAWRADPRPGIRGLAAMAVVVVIFQGLLGGLRVILNSLDLAIVHFLTAQLFFAVLVALAVMTSKGWVERLQDEELNDDRRSLARLGVITALVILGQMALGALLRHPGEGINFALAMVHIAGAAAVFGVAFALIRAGLRKHRDDSQLRRGLMSLMFVLTLQIVLGFAAYFILLTEAGLIRSNLQVIINTLHVICGVLLWGSAVAVAVWAHSTPLNEAVHADKS